MTPYVEIEVVGTRRSVVLPAMFDTGFDGGACVPTAIAVTLGLELIGDGTVEYADGRRERELVFGGSVKFLGMEREAEISLTEGDEALAGTGLVAGYRAVIDFDTGDIQFERKSGQSSPK